MAMVQIPCAHDYCNTMPELFAHKSVDVVINYRIWERYILQFADGRRTVTPHDPVDGGRVITHRINPWCPQCKDLLTSFYVSHNKSLQECNSLLDFIEEEAETLISDELNQNHPDELSYSVLFGVDRFYHLGFEVGTLVELLRRESLDELDQVGERLTPASHEAIEALERISLSTSSSSSEEATNTTTCAICLEDLMANNKDDEVGRRLPCKHEFHEDCILEWLHTSHYCPLCRFELPATALLCISI